jgi:serine/threonine protein kinase/tetratricopeptide (TPR) repeat protein
MKSEQDSGDARRQDRPAFAASLHQRVLEDRLAGRTPSLAEYQADFPGFEDWVAEELAGLEKPDPALELEFHLDRLPLELGPFRITQLLGEGGQGRVFLATDQRLERPVALKVLLDRHRLLPDGLRRLRREAQLASRLQHRNIATVYEADSIEDVPYVALQYVEGETLQRLIQGEAGRSPLSRHEGLRRCKVLAQIAAAVQHAHEQGILHRDLKPGNLMIQSSGEPVVLDFGLAREVDPEVSLTRSGELCGTPAYLPPEQIQGTGQPWDAQGDVYALGVILYEWLTGRRPFRGATTAALFRAILREPFLEAQKLEPSLPRDLSVVIATALMRDPLDRYRTAGDLAADLRAVERGEPVSVVPLHAGQRLWRWLRGDPPRATLVSSLAVATLVLAGLAGFFLARQDDLAAGREVLLAQRTERQLLKAVGFRGSMRLYHHRQAIEDSLKSHPDQALLRVVLSLDHARAGEREALDQLVAGAGADPDEQAALRRVQSGESVAVEDLNSIAGPLEAFALAQLALTKKEVSTPDDWLASRRYLLLAHSLSRRPQALFSVALAETLSSLAASHAKLVIDEGPRLAASLLKHWPDSAAALSWAATVLSYADVERGMALQRRALELDPDLVESMNMLCIYAVNRGDMEQADQWYARVCETLERTDQVEPWFHHLLFAELMIRYDRPQAAVLPLRTALTLDSSNEEGLRNLAYTLSRLDRFAEAIEPLRQWASLEPGNLQRSKQLAEGLLRANHTEDAWLVLEEALEAAPVGADQALLDDLAELQATLDP